VVGAGDQQVTLGDEIVDECLIGSDGLAVMLVVGFGHCDEEAVIE
jgi:hypothetical protein